MTKEQYRKSILQLVYGSFKNQTEGTTTENESSIINAITDLIVEDSFASYVPEHTEIIPSNFSTIWSYYRCSVNDFFKATAILTFQKYQQKLAMVIYTII